MHKTVVIIGGGLAGTAAARALAKRGYATTILERNDYLGGRVRTHLVNGAAVEMGAGFLTRIYSNLRTFLRDENLHDTLYPQHGSSGMVRNGQIRMLDIPTMLGGQALSWEAKRQLLPLLAKTLARWQRLDPHAFWKADRYDERSVAAMFPRHRQEIVEYLLQPLLNGYFYWAPERVSEAMLFMLVKAALVQGDSYRMKGGLCQIPYQAAQGSAVLLGCQVQSVVSAPDGRYEVTAKQNGKQKRLVADGVVCATTASVAPAILPGLTPAQRAFFEAVEYSSTAVLARTYRQEQTRGDKGIAFPRQEGSELAAVTVAPEPGRPGALATVKLFASGAVGQLYCAEQDTTVVDKLAAAAEPVMDQLLAGSPKPMATHVQRWPQALPFFDVGHFKRLRDFEDGKVEHPTQRLVFAGDYLGGPFMEGAFTSGQKAAERLARQFTK